MEHQIQQYSVNIHLEPTVTLEGTLTIPDEVQGVILFAHGSGGGRHSPRNQLVAEMLNWGGFATLLVDLLTAHEEVLDLPTRHLCFDIPLLAKRLIRAIDWLTEQPETHAYNIGLFGTSTSAGAALVAAAFRSNLVSAIVSRGGRPDLAGSALPYVQAPTLLIVGGDDEPVQALNREAVAQMKTTTYLEIVPGTSQLFGEPGKVEVVATLSHDWFAEYLTPNAITAGGNSLKH
jgi:putative phosphoribosyl transferase